MIQKATNISSDFRYFRLRQIAEQIETHTTVIQAFAPKVQETIMDHVQILRKYRLQEWEQVLPNHLASQLHTAEQQWRDNMVTRNINDIINTAIAEINVVSYSAMPMDETTPDLAIHISDTELERVVQTIIERMSTSTSIYWTAIPTNIKNKTKIKHPSSSSRQGIPPPRVVKTL